jgi:hypothetical protein
MNHQQNDDHQQHQRGEIFGVHRGWKRDAQKSPGVATGRYMRGANCFPLVSIFFRPNFLAKSPTPIGANNPEGVWSFHSYESPALLARLWDE